MILEKLVTLNITESVALVIRVTRQESVSVTFPLNRESVIISM